MVLHCKRFGFKTPKTFKSVVVEVDMGLNNFAVLRRVPVAFDGVLQIEGESVVLRGDFYTARPDVFHGVVGTVVTKRQLVG